MAAMHYGTFERISQFLGMLVVMLAVAKVGGYLVQKLGQPAVLGELIGGSRGGPIVAGAGESRIRDDPPAVGTGGSDPALRHRSGDRSWASSSGSGATSLTVAVVGVALPFALGFVACLLLGFLDHRVDHGRCDPDGHERRDHRPRACPTWAGCATRRARSSWAPR